MQLRERKDWDQRHAEHGMPQSSVAQSVEHDMMRSIVFAAARRDVFCMPMQAAPSQLDNGPKTPGGGGAGREEMHPGTRNFHLVGGGHVSRLKKKTQKVEKVPGWVRFSGDRC